MSDIPSHQPPNNMSPAVALRHLNTGYWISQAIAVAAKLGIADLLKDGPKTCNELAQVAGADPQALYRLLRGIASVGVFAEDVQGRFTLTPFATLLRADVPGSLRAAAMMSGEEWEWRPWGALLHSVRTGQPAFDHIFGMEFDDYLARNPEAADIFHGFMNSVTAEEAMAVAPVYDFADITSIVDVGGGHGALLAAILKANSHLRGVLFDAPQVIAEARVFLEAQGVAQRCDLVAGNFFEALPAGADAYILKWILIGWDDARAVTILRNCHRALKARGKLLIIERIIPPCNAPFYGKLADLNLLVLYRGRHRTEAEYRALFAEADFELARILPTPSPTAFSILEGVRL
jgi:SAM-dependent methyltransferase